MDVFSISLIAAVCSSCSKDEPVQTADNYARSADSASARNEEKIAEVNRRIQEVENEAPQEAERDRAESARRAQADPRNEPFGTSKDFEFNITRPLDQMGYVSYVNVTFAPPDCLSSAGIRVWFGNISESSTSARITYTVSVDALGPGGYHAVLESMKCCKTSIPMTLVSERYKTGERGLTPKFLSLNVSEYGVHVNGP